MYLLHSLHFVLLDYITYHITYHGTANSIIYPSGEQDLRDEMIP